jgi:uncharacterized protein DUF4331
MRKLACVLLAAAAGALAIVAAVTRGPSPEASNASSHREAPLIAEDPSVDSTDLYAFRSPDKPNTVTILANYIGGEDPGAGPNYYTFSPNARYNVNIDRNGDGKAEIVYRFTFKRNNGAFFLGDTAQPYTVTKIEGNHSTVVATGTTPPNNIGSRSTPNYRSLAEKGIVDLKGGGVAFAGQRDDPFFADIGAIFDLLAIRKGTGNAGGGKDFFAGYAVHTIGVQVPISQIDTKSHVVGFWTTAERPSNFVGKAGGKWVQVSRLGNPLVNEVIIPTGLKDQWNSKQPFNEWLYQKYYEKPILAAVINKLYKLGAPEEGRDDLVAVLLTGVPNLNKSSSKPVEELRLNVSIPITPAAKFSRLGVLGGDNQGWPNGRRLGDDVIDTAEQAVGGFLKNVKLPLGDGVNADDRDLLDSFPYAADPQSGFANTKGDQKK